MASATCFSAFGTGDMFPRAWNRLYVFQRLVSVMYLEPAICFPARVLHRLHIWSPHYVVYICCKFVNHSGQPLYSLMIDCICDFFVSSSFYCFSNQKLTALHYLLTSNSLSSVRFGLRFPSSSRRMSRISSRVRYSLACDNFSFKSVMFPIGFLTA